MDPTIIKKTLMWTVLSHCIYDYGYTSGRQIQNDLSFTLQVLSSSDQIWNPEDLSSNPSSPDPPGTESESDSPEHSEEHENPEQSNPNEDKEDENGRWSFSGLMKTIAGEI